MSLPIVVERNELIRRLERLGWTQLPKGRSRETFMGKEKRRLRIPNNHGKTLRPYVLHDVLRRAGVSEEQWHDAANRKLADD